LQGAHRDTVLLLRVPLEGVGLGTGVALQTLGTAASLADDLVGLGTGLGDRLVGGLLSQREDTRGTVAAGALAGHTRTAHGATHRTAHGAAHRLHRGLTHGTGALTHRALTHRAMTLRTATARAGGQLRGTARQLGRTTHGATHRLLRRARYAGG